MFDVSSKFQECFREIFKGNSRKFYGCFYKDEGCFKVVFPSVSRIFEKSSNEISEKGVPINCLGCFKEVSKVL